MYTIYGLYASACPEKIRYIGFSKDVTKRIATHISESKQLLYHRHKWIQKHLLLGESIGIKIIEDNINTQLDAQAREIFWISEYTRIGAELTNGTLGGDGGTPTHETIAKIRNTMKERYGFEHIMQNPDYKKALSSKLKGFSMEQRLGKDGADKAKAAISASLTGKVSFRKGKTNVEYFGEKRARDIGHRISFSQVGRTAPNKGMPMGNKQKQALIRNYVQQQTLQGEIVKIWKGMVEIDASAGFNRMALAHALKAGKPYKGFNWIKVPKT